MNTENKQIVELLSERLAHRKEDVSHIASFASRATGIVRINYTSELLDVLESISRIEALIARYQ